MNDVFDTEEREGLEAVTVDTGTVAWLLPEIVRAFDEATAALREFRAGAAGVDRADVDMGPLRVARSHLHQAHGALELSELEGVSKLTEAMEELLVLFEADPARCDAITLDAIVGGCRSIVEYLEDLQGGGRPQPLYLFPSYRELLTVRKADRVHPADLFVVDLGVRPPREEGGAVLDKIGLQDQRRSFEQALLRYIRNDGDLSAVVALERAVAAIDGSVAATAPPGHNQQRAFWSAARALFEALAHDGFAKAPAQHAHLKRLAGRVNLQIRKLVEGSAVVAERLFSDTLFFVAIAEPVTPHVREVQARYRIEGVVPADFETQRYGRIDTATLKTAREALAAAKAAWSAVVAGDVGQIRDFAKAAAALLDAVRSIKRRGLVQVAQVIDGIATDLGFDPRQPPANVGLDVATALLFLEGALGRARSLDDAFDQRAALVVARVEAAALGQDAEAKPIDWLDRMAREAEERLTVATFVTELQANLRSAEKVLDAFFRDPAQRADLPEAQRSLTQVGGALALLGHDDVHRAIDHARASIARFQTEDAQADPAEFESLARSLGAVGFYVDQIKRDRIASGTFHFDEASGSFNAELARPNPTADRADGVQAAAPDDVHETPVGERERRADHAVREAHEAASSVAPFEASTERQRVFAATEILEPETSLEDEIARRAADASAAAARLQDDGSDRAARESLVAALEDVRRSAQLVDDRGLQTEAAGVLASLRGDNPLQEDQLSGRVAHVVGLANRSAGIAPPAATAAPAPAVPASDNLEAVDAELLGIFLEEADGVLADASASMQVLDADPESDTALTNLRRGFHTLKGSSRMVGLAAFGEAAWSIEDTLNGQLVDQGATSGDLRALVDYAIRYLSDWVRELHDGGTSARIPDALIEAARAVRAARRTSVAHEPAFDLPPAEGVPEPRSATSGDGDFEKTLFLPRETPFEDPHFAATQVLDEPDRSELQFFGEQPQPMEADASAAVGGYHEEPAATMDRAAAEHAEDHAHDDVEDNAHDDVDGDARERADHDDEEGRAIDGVTALEQLFPSFAGPVGPFFEMPEDAIATDLHASTEPAAYATGQHDEATSTVPADDASAPATNVVAFTPPHDEPSVRSEDVRVIGPLTLSLALFNIYLTEADELLRVLTQDFAEWRHELDRFVSENAMRAAHSLAGSSATVGLVPAHDLASMVEDVLMALWRAPTVLDDGQIVRLIDAVESLRRMLHRFAAERMPDPDPVRIAALLALRREIGAGDGTNASATDALPFGPLDFDDEEVADRPDATVAVDHATPASETQRDPLAVDEHEEAFFAPLESPDTGPSAHDEAAATHATDAFEALPDLSFAASETDAIHRPSPHQPTLESASEEEHTQDGPIPSLVSEAGHADAGDGEADHAVVDVDEVGHADAEHSEAHVAQADVAEVEHAEVEHAEVDEAEVDEAEAARAVADQARLGHAVVDHAGVDHEASAAEAAPIVDPEALAAARRAAALQRESAVRDDIDPDLLEVFVAEGGEILPQVSTLFRTWQSAPANPAPARMLLRLLHTLKGSARMAGAMRLGEGVHDIETRIEDAARLPEVPAALIDELLAAHDRSLELFEQLQRPQPTVAESVEQATGEVVAAEGGTADAPITHVEPAMAPPSTDAAIDPTPRMRDAKQAAQAVQAVRVASDTLDRLVNLAGEVSISRARIENEVQQIKGAMGDLAENVDRLRSQLREIELQAEFQMQSRKQSQQTAGAEREKFDPLEFDRFTRFQELTRMMAESVNDVKTVQQNLQRSLDTAETDLASQRRMTRELQQDLMKVRMVPFSSIAERLYRVARRTAKEVDKRVNLDIRGTAVEIDRGVLERMAGPFEHLLRNHIVHGVESREARRVEGKSETGELLVEARQEGNEIVLTFSDDGSGLDYDRIRAKGRELGLIGDAGISDAQAAELIFHPGFSTATEITELAGRGIGMDVVRAEAQELGGRVAIESDAGKGTRFTIHLPLTLAITQVVLVAVAERVYALPAVLVEQVQQMRSQALADAYRAGHLEWADTPIRLAFLGSLLGLDGAVPVAQRVSPVLILRSGGERIAVHVDEVVANQEVVVKNLGPQLARMIGIVGATVLGSGDIVLILNPVQLVQIARPEPARDAAIPAALEQAPADEGGLQTLPTVMVVDDSLTVRRVTQRLLSREGYQVVLAKDGVDALEQMHDFPPDAMLVDIEMPRMDGFDLTRNIRADERYKHIPIIMITSRTAEKHRQHAAELGVDAYLGKPYQEDELLELLARHVAARRGQPA